GIRVWRRNGPECAPPVFPPNCEAGSSGDVGISCATAGVASLARRCPALSDRVVGDAALPQPDLARLRGRSARLRRAHRRLLPDAGDREPDRGGPARAAQRPHYLVLPVAAASDRPPL